MSGDNQQVRDMILKRSLLGGFWHVYDKNNRYYENVLNPSLLENTGLVNNDNLFSLSATDLNVQLLRSLREALKHSTSIMNVLLPPEVGNVKKLKNRKKFFECITKAIDADLGAMASTSLCIFRPFDCESLQIAL